MAKKKNKRNIEKPELETLQYYDYHKCVEYIEAKIGKDLRDYAGKHEPGAPSAVLAYQDFWHTVLDKVLYGEVHNDGYYYLEDLGNPEEQENWEDWEKEIAAIFASEFDLSRKFYIIW